MSSVVNKSKNKFVPKAKVRPRPSATPVRSSQEPSQTPEPSRQPSSRPVSPILQRATSVAVSQSDVSESEREGADRSSVAPRRRDSSEVPRPISLSRHASEDIPVSEARTNPKIPHFSPWPQNSMHIEGPGARPQRPAAAAIEIPMARSRRDVESTAQTIEMLSAQQIQIPMSPVRSQLKPLVREATIVENGEPDENITAETGSAAKPARKPRAQKPTAEGKGKAKASTQVKGRGRKRKVDSEAEGTGEGEYEDENEGEEPSGDDDEDSPYEGGEKEGPSKAKKPRKKRQKTAAPCKPRQRKARAESPEDGEERRIEESVMLMKDLCRDPKIGRKSKRFVELGQMDWTKIVREQRAAKAEMQARKEAGEDVHEETLEERLERMAQANGLGEREGAPQMRVVNGELVLDEESLQIDRHQADIVEQSHLTMEVVEEDRHTRLVNSSTFSKREKVEKWDAGSTERFFEGLSIFGTDFELISRLFPGRSRRQMKNKFNAEERKNPKKVTEALMNRAPIDMIEYSEIAGMEFGDPALLEQELQQIREQQEAQDALAKENQLQTERERQEQANAAMHADEANAAAAFSADVQPKRRNKKAEREADRRNEQVLDISIEEYEAMRQREREQEEEERLY